MTELTGIQRIATAAAPVRRTARPMRWLWALSGLAALGLLLAA